jgi:hypothetical protein
VEAEAEGEGRSVKRVGLVLAALLIALTAMSVASASDLPVVGGTVQMVALEPTPTFEPTSAPEPTQSAIPFVPATVGPTADAPLSTPGPMATASDPTPVPVESAPAATATPQPDPSASP